MFTNLPCRYQAQIQNQVNPRGVTGIDGTSFSNRQRQWKKELAPSIHCKYFYVLLVSETFGQGNIQEGYQGNQSLEHSLAIKNCQLQSDDKQIALHMDQALSSNMLKGKINMYSVGCNLQSHH